MSTRQYRLVPIDPAHADVLRELGGTVVVADEHPGYPCRQCLRDADIGDELVLVSHDPFTTASPYRSASPIFLHRRPCRPPVDDGDLPVQLTRRQLSIRSFDRDEMMVDATVIDGSELHGTIERFFADGSATCIHVHNASPGCWAVAVEPTTVSERLHSA